MQTSENLVYSYLEILRRRWVICATTILISGAILVPVAVGLPNLYRATATLMVDQAHDPLSQRDSQMLELGGRLQAIRQLALSRQRVFDLAQELDLYRAQRDAGEIDAIVGMLQRDVKVEPTSALRSDGRVTTISFRVSYTGNDPQKVAMVANRLAQFYVDRNDDIQTRYASRTVEGLRESVEAARKSLDAQDRKVSDFTRENARTLPSQLGSNAARVTQLTTQYQTHAAEISRLTEKRETAQSQIASLSTSAVGRNEGDPVIRLAVAERELTDLLFKYYPEHFDVRNKRMEIEGLRAQVAKAKANGSGNGEPTLSETLQSQVQAWDGRIAALRKENDRIQTELDQHDVITRQIPVNDAEYQRLTREADRTRQQYEQLNARYQAALVGERAQQGSASAEFQILDKAVVPESPTAPDRRALTGLATLAAIALGLVLALIAERMDTSFRSVDELRAFTHVPVLATIPRIISRRSRVTRLIGASIASAALVVVLWFVSVGVFQSVQHGEALTRMLLR